MSHLTFEEWKKQLKIKLGPNVAEDLKFFHGIDVEVEIEEMLLEEYEQYLKDMKK